VAVFEVSSLFTQSVLHTFCCLNEKYWTAWLKFYSVNLITQLTVTPLTGVFS